MEQQKVRVQFENEYVLRAVIFADESKFKIIEFDGRSYVWRKKITHNCETWGWQCYGIGCMATPGIENVHFINDLKNKPVYMEILKRNLKESAEKLRLKDQFCFYLDNDPKHFEMLLYNCLKIIKTPAQSPDRIAIEHVCAKLEADVRKHAISSKKKYLLEESMKSSAEFTKKLVDSIQNKRKEVVANKRMSTRY